jgi:hypothetical protein
VNYVRIINIVIKENNYSTFCRKKYRKAATVRKQIVRKNIVNVMHKDENVLEAVSVQSVIIMNNKY